MVTLNDVAVRAGVSASAVSRVLRDVPGVRVSAATRARIHQAAAELGYRPNLAARGLKVARTHVVGLVVPDLTNAIFAELMRGVEDEAQRRGYVVLLARADGVFEGEAPIPRLVTEGRVDGVLVQPSDAMRSEDLEALVSSDLPVVFVNSAHPAGGSSVVLDDEGGIVLATSHLIGLGHERIALLGGSPVSDTAQRRERGFRRAMADAGLAVPDAAVTRFGYTPADGAAAVSALLAVAAPTALVVANVNAAYGVLRRARKLGVQVPADLSVVAMHDQWTAEDVFPPLTTVRMPLYELGRTAMELLYQRIASREAAQVEVRHPAPRLIVRESTAVRARR